jgi:hypothetical protein
MITTTQATPADQSEEQEVLKQGLARLRARHEMLGVPANLEGEEADKFVTRRMSKLAPTALAEVEYRLRLGSSDERYKAALEVLDRAGFSKTDKTAGATSPIVVVNMGGNFSAPWAQKAKTVDAEVVAEKETGT